MKVKGFDHPKMFHLAHLLDVERWAARGLVESVLIITGKYAIRGDIGRMEDMAIALAVDWKGDAGRMITCLVGSKWLDEHPDHRLVVHNWHKHAPGWVKGRLKQDGLDFVGNGPSSSARHATCSSPIPSPIPLPLPGKRPLRALLGASKKPLRESGSATSVPRGTPDGDVGEAEPTEDIIGPLGEPVSDPYRLPPVLEPHGVPAHHTKSPETNAAIPKVVLDALIAYMGNPARIGGKLRSNIERYVGQYGEPMVLDVLSEAKSQGRPWGDLGYMLNERKQKEYDRGRSSGSNVDAAKTRRAAQQEREFPKDDRPVPKLSF